MCAEIINHLNVIKHWMSVKQFRAPVDIDLAPDPRPSSLCSPDGTVMKASQTLNKSKVSLVIGIDNHRWVIIAKIMLMVIPREQQEVTSAKWHVAE